MSAEAYFSYNFVKYYLNLTKYYILCRLYFMKFLYWSYSRPKATVWGFTRVISASCLLINTRVLLSVINKFMSKPREHVQILSSQNEKYRLQLTCITLRTQFHMLSTLFSVLNSHHHYCKLKKNIIFNNSFVYPIYLIRSQIRPLKNYSCGCVFKLENCWF